jgi:hypothetical protein
MMMVNKELQISVSSQLECWNDGTLENWVLDYGKTGVLGDWSALSELENKKGPISFENPIFLHSTIPLFHV